MNMREWRQLTHHLDDDVELEFASEGEVVYIGHVMPVPEWSTVYLGIDEQDVVETLQQWNTEDEDSGAGDDDEWPEDRDAFMEALSKAEDTDTVRDCTGEVCSVPPPPAKPMDEATETM